MELSAAVNVPVRVDIQLTDPVGSQLMTINSSVSGSTYTSRAMVSSFGRDHSGLYSCSATVRSTSPFLIDSDPHLEELRVTTGMQV